MKMKLLCTSLLVLVLLSGCVSEKTFTTNDIEKITLALMKTERFENGISYTIHLKNDSDFVIKQNNVFVSYPIKLGESGLKDNQYTVEAEGNKLDIQPGEKITLHVFMPFEGMGDQSVLGIDDPSIQLKGFIESVDNEHFFSTGGSLIKDEG